MKYEVIWAPSARSDLSHIIQYVLDHNLGAADRVLDRIEAAASSLGDMAMGRRGRMANTFEKVVPGLPYIIAYEIDVTAEAGSHVSILRIIHGARDWVPDRWPSA